MQNSTKNLRRSEGKGAEKAVTMWKIQRKTTQRYRSVLSSCDSDFPYTDNNNAVHLFELSILHEDVLVPEESSIGSGMRNLEVLEQFKDMKESTSMLPLGKTLRSKGSDESLDDISLSELSSYQRQD